MMGKVINELFRICFSQMLDRTLERLLLGGGGNQNAEHKFVLWWFWKRVFLRETFWKCFQLASNVFFLPFPDYFFMQPGSHWIFDWVPLLVLKYHLFGYGKILQQWSLCCIVALEWGIHIGYLCSIVVGYSTYIKILWWVEDFCVLVCHANPLLQLV
jgi:hypothetical protein